MEATEVDGLTDGRSTAAPGREGGKARADHQGDGQQEAKAEDAGERDQVRAQVPPKACLLGLLHIPDGVHGVLELDHDAEGGDQQQCDPGDGGEAPGLLELAPASMASTALLPVSPNSDRNWAVRLPRTASAPKNRPGHAGYDQQQRPHREHGVVGERRSQPGAAMAETTGRWRS